MHFNESSVVASKQQKALYDLKKRTKSIHNGVLSSRFLSLLRSFKLPLLDFQETKDTTILIYMHVFIFLFLHVCYQNIFLYRLASMNIIYVLIKRVWLITCRIAYNIILMIVFEFE